MKNYDHSYLFLFLTIFFLFLIFISFFLLKNITIYTYLSLNGMVITEKEIMIMIEKKEKDIIEKREYFYHKSKKNYYQIIEKRKEENHNFYILSLSDSIKEKENLTLSIPLEKKSLFYILCENWRLK